MYLSSFLLVAVLTNLLHSICALSPRYIQHEVLEKRDVTPPLWIKGERLAGSTVLPVRIALTQSNLDSADDFIMDVAAPGSPNYGQHWTAKDVADTFAPPPATVDKVKVWLQDAGISTDRISLSRSHGWLTFEAPAAEVEALLKTEYHVYEHETGTTHIACDKYSVPQAIREHVDFITPTLHFGSAEHKASKRKPRLQESVAPKAVKSEKREQDSLAHAAAAAEVADHAQPISMAKLGAQVEPHREDISTCDESITPDCLRALYGIPSTPLSAPGNSLGIVEYTPQSYRQEDLDMFFAQYAPDSVGSEPVMQSIDGGRLYTEGNGSSINLESNLDFEYSIPFVHPLEVALFQVGDGVISGSFDDFLDAIDGSFCTYDSGDVNGYDPVWPDPKDGGYKGPPNCGEANSTLVVSTSYSIDEAFLSAPYLVRQCHEYMKLSLMGMTIIFSSGDYGVAGNGGNCQGKHGIRGVFRPGFPASCPYVTSVGATQVAPGNSVTDPEIAANLTIYSGGGFSNVFPIPSYQNATIAAWWAAHKPGYSSQQFNTSQASRGFPDVAVNGVNYVVASDDDFGLVYGTSCSAPVMAALLTNVNDELLRAGKKPVGFINPVLYAHPEILTDITIGNNPGCGTTGFDAVPGWDPVTGLGTPNYQKMLDLFMGLQS